MPRATPAAAAIRADPDVDRWYRNLSRGSASTADINLRRLAAFCAQAKTAPAALLKLPEKALHDAVLDFVSAEEARGMAGSYVVRTVKAVKSWLAHNGVAYSRRVKVKGSQETPTLKDERTPSQEELRLIFLGANPRTRLCAALMAHSGVRPEVLGNYLGHDGLRLSDFPELRLRKGTVELDTIPTQVRVRSELSKTATGYLTFLSTEGCGYLKAYLEERLRGGERLGPESDLIHPDRARKLFIRALNIGDGVRAAIRAAGFPWRPYVLRSFFDTQLLLAESKGKVTHSYRVFWMGHVGAIDARYTTNKGQLTKDLVDDMRAAYKRCEPFLSTNPTNPDDDGVNRVLRALLLSRGMSATEADKLELASKSEGELVELFKKLGAATLPSVPAQRAVRASEVPGLLEAGWEYVAPLDGGLAVLRVPSPPAGTGLPAGRATGPESVPR
jgi:hypothetical protein